MQKQQLDDLSDEALIQLVTEYGNVHAFRLLFSRYSPIVLGLSTKIVGDRSLAEEIAQETFWRVWHNAASFRADRGTFTNWMFGIARNLSIDALRRYKRQPTQPFLLDEHGREEHHQQHVDGPDVGMSDEVADTAWMRWRQKEILAAMDELPPEQRDVIVWVYFQGRTRREIAREERIPFGTINTRARLALNKLRLILEGRGIEAHQ